MAAHLGWEFAEGDAFYALNLAFWTLPIALRGSASTVRTARGTLYGARRWRAHASSSAGSNGTPGRFRDDVGQKARRQAGSKVSERKRRLVRSVEPGAFVAQQAPYDARRLMFDQCFLLHTVERPCVGAQSNEIGVEPQLPRVQ